MGIFNMKNVIHKFINETNNAKIFIEKEYSGYMLHQIGSNGSKQHLKMNETQLCSFLSKIDKSSWKEIATN